MGGPFIASVSTTYVSLRNIAVVTYRVVFRQKNSNAVASENFL